MVAVALALAENDGNWHESVVFFPYIFLLKFFKRYL